MKILSSNLKCYVPELCSKLGDIMIDKNNNIYVVGCIFDNGKFYDHIGDHEVVNFNEVRLATAFEIKQYAPELMDSLYLPLTLNERQVLIDQCDMLINEIEDFEDTAPFKDFHICVNSEIIGVCKNLVPRLMYFGIENIKGFCPHIEFQYSGEYYNSSKINHVEMYLEHLLEEQKQEKQTDKTYTSHTI